MRWFTTWGGWEVGILALAHEQAHSRQPELSPLFRGADRALYVCIGCARLGAGATGGHYTAHCRGLGSAAWYVRPVALQDTIAFAGHPPVATLRTSAIYPSKLFGQVLLRRRPCCACHPELNQQAVGVHPVLPPSAPGNSLSRCQFSLTASARKQTLVCPVQSASHALLFFFRNKFAHSSHLGPVLGQ